MPILDVRIVGPVTHREGLSRRVADAAARVFKSNPQDTWVMTQFVQAADYAENAGGPPEGIFPIFVTVVKKNLPAAANELDREAKALTDSIGQACGRSSDCVHVLYEPPAAGRISLGGQVVR